MPPDIEVLGNPETIDGDAFWRHQEGRFMAPQGDARYGC